MLVLLSIALADDDWGGTEGEATAATSLQSASGERRPDGLQTVGGGDAVRSPIEQDVVQGLVKGAWPEMLACYQAAEFTERMDVAFTLVVKPDGTVHDVRLDLTEHGLDFGLCLRAQLEGLRFPPFTAKDPVEVSSSIWFAGDEL